MFLLILLSGQSLYIFFYSDTGQLVFFGEY